MTHAWDVFHRLARREAGRVWIRWRPVALIRMPLQALRCAGAALLCWGMQASCLADPLHWARAAVGHLGVLQASRPIEDWLADANTPEPLRERLRLAQELRVFATRELALPDNASYTRYADLGRSAVLWNVVAAPELSFDLKTWCYPVTGCVGYRGHFSEERARTEGRELQAQGWEVYVYGVPAYSTLGWTNWLGGDPLLNTFAQGSPIELARLMFHELAHQVAYAAGDMAFSEGYATALEQLGLDHWAAHPSSSLVTPAQWSDWRRRQLQRRDFSGLLREHKAELAAVYRSRMTDEARMERKRSLQAQFRDRYEQWRDRQWQGDRRFDGGVEALNNAALALQGSYQDWVPAFTALFEREGRDFARFHSAVKRLAEASPADRRQAMRELCSTCVAHSGLP